MVAEKLPFLCLCNNFFNVFELKRGTSALKTITSPLIWVKFGELLGKIIAPIVMALVYFVVLTPISLILRLIKKDILKLKILKNADSYWIKRIKKIGSMKKQF